MLSRRSRGGTTAHSTSPPGVPAINYTLITISHTYGCPMHHLLQLTIPLASLIHTHTCTIPLRLPTTGHTTLFCSADMCRCFAWPGPYFTDCIGLPVRTGVGVAPGFCHLGPPFVCRLCRVDLHRRWVAAEPSSAPPRPFPSLPGSRRGRPFLSLQDQSKKRKDSLMPASISSNPPTINLC